jgi:Inositol polyphosphate kinase
LKKLECYSSSLFVIIEGDQIDMKMIDFCHSFVRNDEYNDSNVLDGFESLMTCLSKYLVLRLE